MLFYMAVVTRPPHLRPRRTLRITRGSTLGGEDSREFVDQGDSGSAPSWLSPAAGSAGGTNGAVEPRSETRVAPSSSLSNSSSKGTSSSGPTAVSPSRSAGSTSKSPSGWRSRRCSSRAFLSHSRSSTVGLSASWRGDGLERLSGVLNAEGRWPECGEGPSGLAIGVQIPMFTGSLEPLATDNPPTPSSGCGVGGRSRTLRY